MAVTREAEGHDKPAGDDDLPIDIHYKQLVSAMSECYGRTLASHLALCLCTLYTDP